MQYVYSTVYVAAGGGGWESIFNDCRLFENRLLSKKCMKISILARFGGLFFFLDRQNFFDADGGDFWATQTDCEVGDFWGLSRPLLATCGPKYLATLPIRERQSCAGSSERSCERK